MPGCRCPRCLPLYKTGDESAESHKVRSKTLLAQSRKSAALKVARLDKPASTGKQPLSTAVRKDPQKSRPVKKAKPASGESAKEDSKKVAGEKKPGKKAKAKAEAPPKRVSAAVQQIKAWLQGVGKDFQSPTTGGKSVKGEPKKKSTISKSRQKITPQKTAPHHFPVEPATSSASRPQWPSLSPTALPEVR